ncbi:MAG: hypothetical protein WBQ43_05610 [Terriglobales bacterium]
MSIVPEVRPVNFDLKRQGLLYVLSEALEKFSRLRQILKRQQIFIRAEHAEGQSATAVDKLINYLEEHGRMFLGNSDRVALLLRGKPLNEADRKAVIHDLGILIVHTLQVHELLLLLPREPAKPQASFLLQDCFGRRELQASIVLTNLFSAYEYRFEDILEKVNVEQEERMALTHGGNVLCQAFGDKDNPLAWAVLAHEYGHVLDDHDAISKKLLQPEPTLGQVDEVTPKPEPDFGAAVVAETVADFIAAHVLGPASLMPILFVEMMQPKLRGIPGISAGHPPTPVRVQLVCEYLKQLGVTTSDFEPVFEAYKLDYQRKLTAMDKDPREGLEAMEKEAERLLSPLAERIAEKVDSLALKRFEERDIESARTLQQALGSKQPISSRRSRSNEEISAGLNSLEGGELTPEKVYAVLAGLDELPVPGSQILSAGWLYRLSSFEDVLMKTFPEEAGQKADLDEYGKYVEKTDGLLLKSLELADVHAVVLGRLASA